MPLTCAKELIVLLLSDSNIQFQMLESPQGNEMQETLKERSPQMTTFQRTSQPI